MYNMSFYQKLVALAGLSDPFEQAIYSAHIIWSRRYPEWEAAFFDAHFLQTRVLGSMQEGYPPSAAALALEWVNQFDTSDAGTEALVDALTPVAADFLYLVDSELRYYVRELDKMRTVVPTLGARFNGALVAMRRAIFPRRRATPA